MSTQKKTNGSADAKIRSLQRENSALKKRLKIVENERDSYLRTVHCWAKERITPEEVERWSKECDNWLARDDGKSILDVVREVGTAKRR